MDFLVWIYLRSRWQLRAGTASEGGGCPVPRSFPHQAGNPLCSLSFLWHLFFQEEKPSEQELYFKERNREER